MNRNPSTITTALEIRVRIKTVPGALERAQRADVSFPHAAGQRAAAAVAVRCVLICDGQRGAPLGHLDTIDGDQAAEVGCV